jgi:hypothetical protein
MKIISRKEQNQAKPTSEWRTRLEGIWQFGITWDRDQQAQEYFSELGKKLFDNKYTLVRNVTLPGLDIPIPLVLVGPSGVRVIYASALKGFYRAKDETWAEVDNRTHRFRPARPNLVNRALLMARAIDAFLENEGFNIPTIEPVLFFSQPGIHVDSIRSAARIILTDGLERFAASLVQSRTVLNAEDIDSIAEILIKPAPQPSEGKGLSPWQQPESIGKLRMRRWQWLVIAVLVVLEICILALALMIFISTF